MTYVEIEPLSGKYYTTNISVKLPDDETLYIEIGGYNREPSPRELARGWEYGDGMDHVEGDKVYEVACRIKELLEEIYR